MRSANMRLVFLFLVGAAVWAASFAGSQLAAADPPANPAGDNSRQSKLKLTLQSRDAITNTPNRKEIEIAPERLAVVVVDIWTQHPCTGATEWAAQMIPQWNEFLHAARALGIQVIFASSGDDLKRWEGKPQRIGITSLPNHPLPKSNNFLSGHGFYGPWPSDCMCPIKKINADGSPVLECKGQAYAPNQDPRVIVRDEDLFIAAGHYDPASISSAIASWGQPAQQELWNFTQEKQVTHLLYIGDSTNMCVINREFAMIMARRLGLQSILVRDLTNAMTFHGYNPETKQLDPTLTPDAGTAKSVEYVEQKIGPSIDSQQILAAARELKLLPSRARNNHVPLNDHHWKKVSSFIESVPVPEYEYASDAAYEAFQDMKYGVRIHWGPYCMQDMEASWGLLWMTNAQRQQYQEAYKTWNPQGFNADEWMDLFARNGLKMFAFTTKHHDGFSMFDTKTRVKQRINWTAPGGAVIEDCDLAYSIMETPFKRDVVQELCVAAHKRDIKIDLYFSHPDWYDADFRTYGYHPMMTQEGKNLLIPGEFADVAKLQGGKFQATGPNHTPEQRQRMLDRHRAQLLELMTNYGKTDMSCLDQWMAVDLWPQMRETLIRVRKAQPDVMLRARGIGNYGDYYTPEGFVPGSKENTNMPWFAIDGLGARMAYQPDAKQYRGAGWIVRNLVDTVAKGGNFMVGIGPDPDGRFHPTAIEQLGQAGDWLKVNGEAIYATRPREGQLWKEGDSLRFTRTKDNKHVYAFCLNWPGESLTIKSVVPRADSEIKLLGVERPLSWRLQDDNLVIQIPKELQPEESRPCGYAWAIKIEGK